MAARKRRRSGLRGSFPAAALCTALAASGCANLGAPDPLVPYRAEVDVEIREPDGTVDRVRFFDFHRDGLRRRQLRDRSPGFAVIERPDLGVVWLLDPVEKAFEEWPLNAPEAARFEALIPFDVRGDATFDPVDDRGGPSDRVEFVVEGERISGRAWLTAQNVPLRFEGTIRSDAGDRRVEIVYRGYDYHEPIPSLFAIPVTFAGYADRKKPPSREDVHNEEAVRRLREEGRRRPPRTLY